MDAIKINQSDNIVVAIFKIGLNKMVNDGVVKIVPVACRSVDCTHAPKFRMENDQAVMPHRETSVRLMPVRVTHDTFLVGKCPDCRKIYVHHMSWHATNRAVIDEKRINRG